MDMDIAQDNISNDQRFTKTRKRPEQTWYEWFWGIKPKGPARPTDAQGDPALRAHFIQMMDQVDPPDSFKPSEVTVLLTPKELKNLGYETGQEALMAVYELAFEFREFGLCEILRKGKVLGEDVDMMDIDGPIRIRRIES